MEPPRGKLQIKMKKSKIKLTDDYVITNKHIICRFKYIIMCFDGNEQGTRNNGLVLVPFDRLKKSFIEQNLCISSSSPEKNNPAHVILNKINEWHHLVNKVEVDFINLYEIHDPEEYDITWDMYGEHLISLQHNTCIKNEKDFNVYLKHSIHVLDIKVCFELVKKIVNISDFGVNLTFLSKLLFENIMWVNKDHPSYLDEICVSSDCLPFLSDDQINQMVYPYVYLLPLYHYA